VAHPVPDQALGRKVDLDRALRAAQRDLLGGERARRDQIGMAAGLDQARLDLADHPARILQQDQREIVEAAAEMVAPQRLHPLRRRADEPVEVVEEVHRIARGHADVGARPLEAREGARQVAQGPEVARGDALFGVAEQGVMAEIVADLKDSAALLDPQREPLRLVEVERQRLLAEHIAAGIQRGGADRVVLRRRRQDVDRVDLPEHAAEVGDDALGWQVPRRRPGARRRIGVGEPQPVAQAEPQPGLQVDRAEGAEARLEDTDPRRVAHARKRSARALATGRA
jgi:hypothetical protein